MAQRTPKKKSPKKVETFTHDEASRKNIPTAEFEAVMRKEDKTPIRNPRLAASADPISHRG
jgi:adenine-specific DNA-methyltransferase